MHKDLEEFKKRMDEITERHFRSYSDKDPKLIEFKDQIERGDTGDYTKEDALRAANGLTEHLLEYFRVAYALGVHDGLTKFKVRKE